MHKRFLAATVIFQNAFTVCNVALDSVVSDMFGKSATAITDYLGLANKLTFALGGL